MGLPHPVRCSGIFLRLNCLTHLLQIYLVCILSFGEGFKGVSFFNK